MPAEILLYALVAAGLVFWLRSILGTGHDDGPARPNPFTSQETQEEPDKVNAGFTPQTDDVTFLLGENSAANDLPRNVSVSQKAESGLADIARADRNFDTAHFAQGSESAFIMIVEAFAKGERDVLKDLLSKPVFKAFESVITKREDDGETVETEIHAVRNIEILAAVLAETKAIITVQFTADETCIIRDKHGEITSGDPERMTEMKDIWVFARDVKSRDPVWELVETRDGEPEDHKTPLPDAS